MIALPGQARLLPSYLQVQENDIGICRHLKVLVIEMKLAW